jgi:hypothetical protein
MDFRKVTPGTINYIIVMHKTITKFKLVNVAITRIQVYIRCG